MFKDKNPDAQLSSNPVPTPPRTTKVQLPTPRTFNGKKYYGTDDVAKIIGVTRRAVSKWQNELYFGCPLFAADERAHDGRYLYEVERVMQLASVYHPNWMRGGYEPSPTTAESRTPRNALQMRRFEDVVQDLKRVSLNELIARGILEPAANFNSGSQTGLCCPFCNSGRGDNHTGAGQFNNDNTFFCHACQNDDNGGKSLSTIDLYMHARNISDFKDAVSQMAQEFSVSTRDFLSSRSTEKKSARHDKNINPELLEMIREDIRRAQADLDELPADQCRCLTPETMKHFGFGFLSDWLHPNHRLSNFKGNKPSPTRRLIIPTSDKHYNAVLLDCDRKEQNKSVWKQHTAGIELFNQTALTSDSDIVVAVEGEVDAASVWQASAGNIAVVGVIGGNKNLLLNAIEKLHVKDKKFLILFDNDAGQDNARRLLDALTNAGYPAVSKIFDDAIPADDQKFFTRKIDANEILKVKGNEFLHQLTNQIISDARADFETPTPMEEEETKRLSDDDLSFYFKGDSSDLDFAYRLERFCGDRVKWLIDDERWLIYGNGVWQRGSEKNSCVSYFGRELANVLSEFAKDDAERKLANAFKSAKKIGQAVTLLKSCDSIRIKAKDLDNHTELLNFQNCVVDLSDGKIYPHDDIRLKFLTQQCVAVYDSNAQSALVDKFFADIQPDEETRAGLLRWLGYCLTGETSEEKFAVWTGESGANGKSTLSATILELLGTYACELPTRALLRKRFDSGDADKATTALNAIENARFAISQELPADSELDSALIKNLSGSDHIPLRKNYGEYRTVRATAKINLCGNYTPKIENIFDGGILRRLINFNFAVRFGTPEHPADFALKKKLLLPENLSALAAILVRESVAWYRGSGLIISSLMRKATEQHLSQNDFISDFISDNYLLIPNATVKAKDFVDELKHEYPRECSRFKRNDLIKLIEKVDGVTYCEDRKRFKVFRGIGKAADDLGSEPVNPNTANPFDDLPI